ncbi:kinase-like domain-containing protein, partial [Mycena rosella]
KLGKEEKEWAHYQPFLEEHNYLLRPRYRPGCVSEVTLGSSPLECEEAIPAVGFEVLDATRVSDGAQVVLKVIRTTSTEAEIAAFLRSTPRAEQHTIPFRELLPMYDDPERTFLVMPRMRQCSLSPWFATVREFVEFVQQVLEGLVFLHSNNIAHRDICSMNIVMDSSRMIPGGFHFVNPSTSDGINHLRESTGDDSDPHLIRSRTHAGPIHYCYIDFGLSVRFPSVEARQLVTGYFGRLRKRVPEISATVPYDAFKLDVRLVGEMLRSEFLLHYIGLDFLVPFVKKLRRHNPEQRPEAGEALALFERLVSKMS